ncbi:pyroglutamyl-peptidase I family protein [Cellulosimicrobium marinum]|uniref:pyroglutamyl-peptidase I family protein n=1 Tax=Cellulosimicrobium marinum TaxID=1638992 RepID=UPI001E5D4D51|nr:pyroglutamyl-peptidase I [Cellulosimicrobium marinum]MCB7137389.1 pyroglutamyl-peptidase I [Cellulosimicrobium marinum]
MTVLVSGFEPFGGGTANPSWETARELAARGRELVGVDVAAVRLPVTFAGAWPVLAEAIREHGPDVVVALGLAGGSRGMRLERVAIDVLDARIPDNDGAAPVDEPVVPGGPAAYWSGLPLKSALAALRALDVPAEVSNTAGTYVCNATFYHLMHHAAGTPGLRAGFVHVPPAEVLAVDAQVLATAAVVRAALVGGREPVLAAGALD